MLNNSKIIVINSSDDEDDHKEKESSSTTTNKNSSNGNNGFKIFPPKSSSSLSSLVSSKSNYSSTEPVSKEVAVNDKYIDNTAPLSSSSISSQLTTPIRTGINETRSKSSSTITNSTPCKKSIISHKKILSFLNTTPKRNQNAKTSLSVTSSSTKQNDGIQKKNDIIDLSLCDEDDDDDDNNATVNDKQSLPLQKKQDFKNEKKSSANNLHSHQGSIAPKWLLLDDEEDDDEDDDLLDVKMKEDRDKDENMISENEILCKNNNHRFTNCMNKNGTIHSNDDDNDDHDSDQFYDAKMANSTDMDDDNNDHNNNNDGDNYDAIIMKYEINPNQDICWSCDIPLSIYNDFIHQHPLLEVTTCSSCADSALAIEDDVQKLLRRKKNTNCNLNDNNDSDADKESNTNSDDDELHYYDENFEMEYCSWCGGNESSEEGEDGQPLEFLLCDQCPRVFCTHCVALAQGGGVKGLQIVKGLKKDDQDWFCLYCTPTPMITAMQKWLSRENSFHQIDDEFKKRHIDDDNDAELQHLIDELLMAEDKKDEAEFMQEYDSEERIRKEIEKEVNELNLDAEATKKMIDNEFHLLKDMWQRQFDKCSDKIAILQDLLESKGVDLARLYASRQSSSQQKYFISDDLDAKVRDILKKQDEERGYSLFNADGWEGGKGLDRNFEDLTLKELNEIEDINTDEEVIKCITNKTKRNSNYSNTILKKALNEEKAFIVGSHGVDVKFHIVTGSDDGTEEVEFSKKGDNRMIVKREVKTIEKSTSNDHKRKRSVGSIISMPSQPSKKKKRVDPESISPTPTKKQTTEVTHSDYSCFDNDICVLATLPTSSITHSKELKYRVSVAIPLAKALKEHQRSGIKFMWNNVCSDIIQIISGSNNDNDTRVKGCVLAHCMGLGKSIQTISLIHTLLTHPLISVKGSQIIKRVLILVPVNTLANWQNEFAKWCGKVGNWDAEFSKICGKGIPSFCLYNYNEVKDARTRRMVVERWSSHGGVLCCSSQSFMRAFRGDDTLKKYFLEHGPDLIVLDEAHLMLNNNKSEISKALSLMKTNRRIALTGTPIQNNLNEYYHMTHWIRPGCLAASEAEFEKQYVKPIMCSLTSDSSDADQSNGEKLLQELYSKVTPFVQRLDSTILESDLKFIQQAVIHVRQTKIQMKLYRAYNKFIKKHGITNFFERYRELFPVNNHPGCLLRRSDNVQQSVDESTMTNKTNEAYKAVIDVLDSDEEDDTVEKKREAAKLITSGNQWWKTLFNKHPSMADVCNGGKVLLLLQILVHADTLGDKVVLFSQCLKTLDFIEQVLQTNDWSLQSPNIEDLNPGKHYGKWRKNIEYLRIDGTVEAKKRGDLVNQFNDNKNPNQSILLSHQDLSMQKMEESTKLFLISSNAGNVGINLVGANRVILFDSNWNPSKDEQALHRCYRYGQEKPVYVYRLLTEGTMEEKVYSRSVNKTNLAARVIDNKDPQRNFTSKELEDIMNVDNWVQCDLCQKWRMLPPWEDVEHLPDKWYCHMNKYDKPRSKCKAKEKSKEFYYVLFHAGEHAYVPQSQDLNVDESQSYAREASTGKGDVNEAEKEEKTKRDAILERLTRTSISTSSSWKDKNNEIKKNPSAVISKYYFHESLLKDQI